MRSLVTFKDCILFFFLEKCTPEAVVEPDAALLIVTLANVEDVSYIDQQPEDAVIVDVETDSTDTWNFQYAMVSIAIEGEDDQTNITTQEGVAWTTAVNVKGLTDTMVVQTWLSPQWATGDADGYVNYICTAQGTDLETITYDDRVTTESYIATQTADSDTSFGFSESAGTEVTWTDPVALGQMICAIDADTANWSQCYCLNMRNTVDASDQVDDLGAYDTAFTFSAGGAVYPDASTTTPDWQTADPSSDYTYTIVEAGASSLVAAATAIVASLALF